MKNKTGFFASFVTVVLLHTYVLSSYKVELYVAQSDAKVSSVINLQQVSLLGPELVVAPVVEEEVSPETEPVIEEVPSEPEPVIEKVIPKPIKKEEVIKKKRIKKKTRKSVSKRLSGGVPGGQAGGEPGGQLGGEPGGQLSTLRQQTVSELYISKIIKMIERKKRYPRISKKMRHEGVVNITFTINKNGTIRHIGPIKKCSHERLNRAAVRILKEIGSFPPIPEEMGKESLSLSVSIRYKILK